MRLGGEWSRRKKEYLLAFVGRSMVFSGVCSMVNWGSVSHKFHASYGERKTNR